jgi:dipeptidase E
MRLLLISSSNVHGYGYLDHAEPYLLDFLASAARVGQAPPPVGLPSPREGQARAPVLHARVAFIPFAQKDYAAYTAMVRERLGRMSVDVIDDLDSADALFVGGGNTFRLLDTLYERDLLDPIRHRVRGGLPYIGSSAGTNVAGPTIHTTNDMPIVWPPALEAFGFVPFQINPHYLDADPTSTHKGETREERIREFLEEHGTPVVGLREGGMLRLDEHGPVRLLGTAKARIFRRGAEPEELEPGSAVAL